jgi:hypothetical protein
MSVILLAICSVPQNQANLLATERLANQTLNTEKGKSDNILYQ